jgi:hypothetical protein
MGISGLLSLKTLPVLAFAGLVAVAGSGYAAANTVPASKAGDGAGAISGYTVSQIKYGLNSTNPANIDTVSFVLDSAPASGSTVKVKLISAGSTWYSCSLGTPLTNVSCTTTSPQATAATATELRVVVAD